MELIKWLYRILVAGGFLLVLDHRLVVTGAAMLLGGVCLGAYYVNNADKYFGHQSGG